MTCRSSPGGHHGAGPRARAARGHITANRLDAFHQPDDLVSRRVARAPRTHEPCGRAAEAFDDGRRIEVAVRHEHAPRGERGGDITRVVSRDRERQRGRARPSRAPARTASRPGSPQTPSTTARNSSARGGGARRTSPARRARGSSPPASEARNSTARAAPTMPSWFCVPVSSRSGAVRAPAAASAHRARRPRLAAEQHADVRAVELVGRAGEQVAVDRATSTSAWGA